LAAPFDREKAEPRENKFVETRHDSMRSTGRISGEQTTGLNLPSIEQAPISTFDIGAVLV